MSLANSSGLILAARVGKHPAELLEALIVTTEGKTDCKRWHSDDGGSYERVLPPESLHYIGKDRTQRLERTNGLVRQQTGKGLSLRHATRTMTEQVGQTVAANESHDTLSCHLLQLELAASSLQDDRSATSRLS